jgi:hypothetical protein
LVVAGHGLDELGAGDLADGAVEVAGVGEVDGLDVGDGAGFDFFRMHLSAKGEADENGELGAGVVAGHVFGGSDSA